MELRQLEYFMSVSNELHFTRAAEKLNISQPSLSQQIKNLETIVGTPLFDRIGRTTALTEAGKILLKHSQKVFHELDQAQAAIRDLNGLRRGKLTIGSLITCVNYLFPSVILKFKRLYPDIKLSVLGMRTGEIKQGLLENELDFGVAFLPVDHEDLENIPLFSEELALAIPVGHPLAHAQSVELKTLEDISTILLPDHYFLRNLIDSYCLKNGITLNPTLELTTLESLVLMVEKGIGATILPKPYLDAINNQNIVTVKIIHPTPKRNIGFVYRKDKFMCAATKVFIDQIKETCQTFDVIKQEA